MKRMTKWSARNRRTAAALAVAAAMLGTAACASPGTDGNTDGDSGDERLTIRVVTSVNNGYYFLAIQQHEELGTWEGADFDVEFIAGTTPTLGQILGAGEADVAAAAGTTEAALQQQGVEQTVVGNILSTWSMYVIANDNTDAETIEELRGANWGISGAGAPSDYSVHKIAQELGWSENDYSTTTFGDIGSMLAGFRSGAVDAIAWTADSAFALEAEGTGRILGTSADYMQPTPIETFSVMDDFAAEHPEELNTFFEMFYDKVKEMQAEPQLFIDGLVEAGYEEGVAERLAEAELPVLSTDGVLSQEELDGLSEGAAFSLGDRAFEDPFEVEYTYWKELQN